MNVLYFMLINTALQQYYQLCFVFVEVINYLG
jgi:hypothetical protein